MITVALNGEFTYEELEREIRVLQDQARAERLRLTVIAKAAVAEEINPQYLATLAHETRSLFTKLNRNTLPARAACSHHGVHVQVGNDSLTFGIHTDGKFRVTIYRSANQSYPSEEYVGYTRAQLEAKAQAICDALGCKAEDEWNGNEGSSGISLILTIAPPIALVQATQNMERRNADCDLFNTWLEQ